MNAQEVGRQQRKRVLAEAHRWIATPYVHQASTRGAGCDCLGLVLGIWRHLYGSEPEKVPAYSRLWNDIREGEPMLEAAMRWFEPVPVPEARAGDLVIFRWRPRYSAKHAGILSRRGSFIHAYEKSGVIESPLISQWRQRIAATFRFPPTDNRK